MNWRRGFLFAGIHLAIAVAMFVWNEAGYWHMFRSATQPSRSILQLAALQEDMTVEFSPCAPGGFIDRETSPMELILGSQSVPLVFAGIGHAPCEAASPFDRFVESRLGIRTKRSEAAIGVVTCLAIAIQWLLVGGLPLIQPRRWWLEPGAFITACVVGMTNVLLLAGALQLTHYPGTEIPFHVVSVLCRFPAFAVLLMWLVWFGLLVWKLLRGGWFLVRRSPLARTA